LFTLNGEFLIIRLLDPKKTSLLLKRSEFKKRHDKFVGGYANIEQTKVVMTN
jgi:hypothetical protein